MAYSRFEEAFQAHTRGDLDLDAWMAETLALRSVKIDRLCERARINAEHNGLHYDIEVRASLGSAGPLVCPMYGVLLDYSSDYYHSQYAPSLVRIFGSHSDYTPDNVLILSAIAARKPREVVRKWYASKFPTKYAIAEGNFIQTEREKISKAAPIADTWAELFIDLGQEPPTETSTTALETAYARLSGPTRDIRRNNLAYLYAKRCKKPLPTGTGDIPLRCPIAGCIINVAAKAPDLRAAMICENDSGETMFISRAGNARLLAMSSAERAELYKKAKETV